MMSRRVRGILFVDYVRMIRSRKDVDWSKHLRPADIALTEKTIDLDGWYLMESFERFGLAILEEIAGGQMDAVRMWGQFQAVQLQRKDAAAIIEGAPRDTLMRFHLGRRAFFDFDAIDVQSVALHDARIAIGYGMSQRAEMAACHQTLGFLERLVELAGASNVYGRFTESLWEGGGETIAELHWK